METEKNVQVGNDELQKALDHMNSVLGKKEQPETLEKAAISHSASHEEANGGQIEHVSAGQLGQIAKGIADLAGLMKSMQEVQKAQGDRMDAVEKAFAEKKDVPGGAPDEAKKDDEGKKKDEKEEVKKSEDSEVLTQMAEMTTLMKSFQNEFQELKKDLDTPVRRSAAGINTLKKSFGGQSEEEVQENSISKARLSNALFKAYEKTNDEMYSSAITLLDVGGKISPSIMKSLEELEIKI